jgi:hypothetical protein
MHGVQSAASTALRRNLTIACKFESHDRDLDRLQALGVPDGVQVLHPLEKPLPSPFGTSTHPLAQPDTVKFIKRLSELAKVDDRVDSGTNHQLTPEEAAAASLFLWNEDIIITRAPGRLDVLGGFAGE